MAARLGIMEMIISNFVRATAYCGIFFVRCFTPFLQIVDLRFEVDHDRFHSISFHCTVDPVPRVSNVHALSIDLALFKDRSM